MGAILSFILFKQLLYKIDKGLGVKKISESVDTKLEKIEQEAKSKGLKYVPPVSVEPESRSRSAHRLHSHLLFRPRFKVVTYTTSANLMKLKCNTLLGVLSGACTNPPALAFASDAISFNMVFPLVRKYPVNCEKKAFLFLLKVQKTKRVSQLFYKITREFLNNLTFFL